METTNRNNHELISDYYTKLSSKILGFISSRIEVKEDAENLAQDVWVRLLSCGKELTESTISSFIYTIARNLINDYLRRMYLSMGIQDTLISGMDDMEISPEHAICARDLAAFEMKRVECLPPQRRTIYKMSRYEECNVEEIAEALQLSLRTVENHLRMGRRDVRSFISAIA